MSKLCECGCGSIVTAKRRYVSGHNLLNLEKTETHRKRISAGQKQAWETKRERIPLGSRRKSTHGYILIKTKPGQGGWEREHTLVMEGHINRRLQSGEEVHHINKRRDDNNITNLYLCRDKRHHLQVESSLVEVITQLVDSGVITFNHITGKYETLF